MLLYFVILLSNGLLALGGWTGLQQPNWSSRIVGGYQIDITEVPWQVSLQEDYYGHNCGGSIIGHKWILTAAHCTNSEHGIIRSEEIRVRVGSSDHSGGGTIHKVKRIISHEKFNVASTLDYDFCLLELEHRITFNENAQPIELVNKYREIRDDTMCLVTGWGLTQSPNESRRFLRGVEVPIMNYQKCVFNYRRIQAVTPRMICAGYEKGEKDACTMDSGGPLVINDKGNGNAVLIGLVSWGRNCARPDYPGVYSRVTEARDWIYKHTGI